MSVLAAYARYGDGQNLEDFLDQKVFTHPESSTLNPEPKGVSGYEAFIEKYKKGLSIEYEAVKTI